MDGENNGDDLGVPLFLETPMFLYFFVALRMLGLTLWTRFHAGNQRFHLGKCLQCFMKKLGVTRLVVAGSHMEVTLHKPHKSWIWANHLRWWFRWLSKGIPQKCP